MKSALTLNIMKHSLILLAALLLTPLAALHAADAPEPNIISLLADDLGHADIPAHGGQGFSMPHLDELTRHACAILERLCQFASLFDFAVRAAHGHLQSALRA